MKRQLTKQEKELSKKNIKRLERELEWWKYQVEHFELIINKGLKLNYERQLEEVKNKYKEASNMIKQIIETIKILKNQIKYGVEIKKSSEEVKK